MNIALCGMMGCGKSTVAKIIARDYGYTLIDTDSLIEEKYGPISAIFEREGEAFFRATESEIIAQNCANCDKCVIALGGGAVLKEENVKALKSCAKLIYLRASEENLVKRLENSADRPLLKGTMRDRVAEILGKRERIYASVSDFAVDTDGLTPGEIAKKVLEYML